MTVAEVTLDDMNQGIEAFVDPATLFIAPLQQAAAIQGTSKLPHSKGVQIVTAKGGRIKINNSDIP